MMYPMYSILLVLDFFRIAAGRPKLARKEVLAPIHWHDPESQQISVEVQASGTATKKTVARKEIGGKAALVPKRTVRAEKGRANEEVVRGTQTRTAHGNAWASAGDGARAAEVVGQAAQTKAAQGLTSGMQYPMSEGREASKDEEEALRHDQESYIGHSLVGCVAVDQAEPDDMADHTYDDDHCAAWSSKTKRCRSGLPFYRWRLLEDQGYLDCFRFCLSKGLDVFGTARQGTECRCGASKANARVWGEPPLAEYYDGLVAPSAEDADVTETLAGPSCVPVWAYTGERDSSGGVPDFLLFLTEQDEWYIRRVAHSSLPVAALVRPLNFVGCFDRDVSDSTNELPQRSMAGCQGSVCRGGLPFFRLRLEAIQGKEDCIRFCLSKGLDVAGIVTFSGDAAAAHECRCGASLKNNNVWHRETPVKHLLPPTHPDAHQHNHSYPQQSQWGQEIAVW
jgi:hypothetical protein